jgi:ribosomal protein S18 acetylase RimI-like enzyme
MIIRNAKPEDAEMISIHLLSAMKDFIYKFIGEEDHKKAKDFLVHFISRENNQYSYENCLVAEENGKVLGSVNAYDGAKLAELRKPIADYMLHHYNNEFELEDETQAGEIYIDSLGVDGQMRGKGIGSKLLKELIQEYVVQKQQTLGLLVDEDNPKAKKLYLKLGFKSVGIMKFGDKVFEHMQR